MKSTINILVIAIVSALLVACSAPSAQIPLTTQPPNDPTIQRPNESTARPNIIFILTDDLDQASIQYMPKLKSLITDQGLTFKNYFVSMSLCCPSRTATLRGQYGHNTQILGNTLPSGGFEKFFQLGEEKSTIAVWLQETGYATMLAGKYLNGFPERTNLMYIPPGWTEWYSAVKGGAYNEFNYTLNENGKQVDYGSKPEDYGTDVYARKSVDFIQRNANDGKPFFVYLAPYAPHSPYTPAPRHEKLFLDLKVPRTPNYNEADVSDKPNFIKNRPVLNARQTTALDADYRKRLQSLQAVDDAIESLVKTLQATGQLDNTYIFFTSDNGYHLGNHRQLTGKVAPYDEELRVTMIVRGPGVPAGKTVDYLAGNIDLAPTWAELAGAKAADFVDGRSLVPLIRDNPPAVSQWRQAFVIENGMELTTQSNSPAIIAPNSPEELLEPPDSDDTYLNSPDAQALRLGVPAFRGIRTLDYSYVEYVNGEKELYDMRNDPYQLQNLASKADPSLIAELTKRLHELINCKAAACRTGEALPFSVGK